MEDNGKYTGRTSRFLGAILALITLFYLFRSLIGDIIIDYPIGSSICNNIVAFPSCYKIKGYRGLKSKRHLLKDLERHGHLLRGYRDKERNKDQ